ncbi:Gfo/Idh/MocA family oxidoreductase [Pontibacter sp. G13]|uniref:Gfo/Idh/MocA family oxidoreductase n=1 Tax=Pontibacter sp. G13 TaxID=3074898 RepID=UPI00288BE938|nr:Gfo/Idh/MocA family oxidoreductase [Pontibacter sp. G13]WNJ19591.1 Gfo/Idh/MocA family oxidoreductase [Pontibacter sp. G13]
MASSPIRIGLLGVGHLGKIHLKLLKEVSDFQLVGFFDPNPEVAKTVSDQFDIKAFSDFEALLDEVDAVDIVAPTTQHFECAKRSLQRGKHLFVEKPVTQTLEEAEGLIKLHHQYSDLKFQVGHVERFNPAFLAVQDRELTPMFIEGHRLAMYNPRGTDVSVVLDLMIHDLDVVLSMVDSPVREISASGVAVVSDSPDIANARIEFENGCVANLTASRISIKNMRRLRFFQRNTYLAVDFLQKQAEVFRLSDAPEEAAPMKFEFNNGKKTQWLVFEQPEVKEVNSIKMELEEFGKSILTDAPIRVGLNAGYQALRVAHEIVDRIQEGFDRVAANNQ